jgi:hypothetical protein
LTDSYEYLELHNCQYSAFFNTTIKYRGFRINNVWQPFYGTPCTASTPATTTQLQSAQCGGTITLQWLSTYANVPFVTGYRFRSYLSANLNQYCEKPYVSLGMNLLANPSYNATYSVEVGVRNTDGTYLPYGTSLYTTPSFPTSQIKGSMITLHLAIHEIIYATSCNREQTALQI